MYSRNIAGTTYTFEPSGGLLNASLVMRDKETDSYWSIMTDEALQGAAKGSQLRHLAGSVKTTWGRWKESHPNSKVLSVEGKEHDPNSHYDKYFESEEGFRKIAATDDRLPSKASIFAFQWQGKAYAVPQQLFANGGAVIEVAGRKIFFYREADDSFYRSTAALLLIEDHHLTRGGGGWQLNTPNGRDIPWDAKERAFGSTHMSLLKPLAGFDTFWYIWSLTHPDTELVEAAGPKS